MGSLSMSLFPLEKKDTSSFHLLLKQVIHTNTHCVNRNSHDEIFFSIIGPTAIPLSDMSEDTTFTTSCFSFKPCSFVCELSKVETPEPYLPCVSQGLKVQQLPDPYGTLYSWEECEEVEEVKCCLHSAAHRQHAMKRARHITKVCPQQKTFREQLRKQPKEQASIAPCVVGMSRQHVSTLSRFLSCVTLLSAWLSVRLCVACVKSV